MDRRRASLLLLALVCAPLAAQEKPAVKLHRIGMLDTVPIGVNNKNLVEFHRGMQELGYVEGQTYMIFYRSAEGRAERFPQLAADLLKQKVDVFLTRGTPATIAAMELEANVPVVASAVADPVETKLVASLQQPGGKLTGLTSNVNELGAKRMELLKALVPRMTRVGALINPDNPASLASWKVIEASAPGLRLKPQLVEVRAPEQLGAAIEAAVMAGIDGLIIGIETLTSANQDLIIDFTGKHRLPAIYAGRQFVEAGGLMSYGVSYPNLYYRAAGFVDKILKGAKPGELAMERPNKFELVINRKTARSLEITIPPDIFLRSDEILD
jgi:putative ABC transport system substrate-binding protein